MYIFVSTVKRARDYISVITMYLIFARQYISSMGKVLLELDKVAS